MPKDGFIVLQRKTLDSWIWGLPPAQFKVALYCLFRANWKPTRWWNGTEFVKLERGQFLSSIRKISEACKVSKWAVHEALRAAQRDGMIHTTNSGRKLTLITVCNYERYQDISEAAPDTNRTITGRSPDIEEQGNHETKKKEMQTSLLDNGSDTQWFVENAEGADRIRDVGKLVRRLKVLADARNISFRETVAALSAWAAANPNKARMKKNWGQFYVRCFMKQDPKPKQSEVTVDGWSDAEKQAIARMYNK